MRYGKQFLRAIVRTFIANREKILSALDTPVSRNLAQPFQAGGLERSIGVEAAGDDAADEGGALFFQQRQHAFLLGDQRVDVGGFTVEVVSYETLCFT